MKTSSSFVVKSRAVLPTPQPFHHTPQPLAYRSSRAPELPGAPPPSGTVDLYWLDLDQLDSQRLYPNLSSDERQRAARFVTAQLQHRFIAARGSLRRILAACLATPAAALRFSYGDKGKPALAEPAAKLEFNLSHSDGAALLAVATNHPLGIDLEPLRPHPEVAAIARRMFDSATADAILHAPQELQSERFLYHWTALEASAKLYGESLFSPPRSPLWHHHLTPQPGWIACLALEQPPQQLRWFVLSD